MTSQPEESMKINAVNEVDEAKEKDEVAFDTSN